ncbi:MAG: hydrogenobyrinic acid a,c-diamide synthase (glutamine-hydrolyzing), partial [Chitinivibrionia bacterium]|nr:hydrogenobyrinic acid a,c-diamide synthase (glutamine-hydrolyzing) [Chitinivibrionia bacterium]
LGAMVQGCQRFDPAVSIRGVVLNRIAGSRHETILRDVIADYCGIPVLGAIPRLPASHFPERHLGLVPPEEHGTVDEAVATAAAAAERYLNLDEIAGIARSAAPLDVSDAGGVRPSGGDAPGAPSPRVRIGVFRDEAFSFYYPENLEALERAGAELIVSSPLRDTHIPEVDAIYIGGGFPETFAEALAANVPFRRAVAAAVEAGMPVYAECAGAMYLGEKLVVGGESYPMAGALPVVFGFEKRPQGHGYAAVEAVAPNPFFRLGARIRGHELHYSRVLAMDERSVSFAFKILRGQGVDGKSDGICRKNTLASYCHIHALGTRGWAASMVEAGESYKRTAGRT